MAVYTQIDNPELYMQVKLYSGTGSELAVTLDGDENMQPDFVWSKNRDQSEGHKIFDSVRGVTKFIMSNNTDAEATAAQTLKSFDSDGVTIGTDADMNTSSETNVLWNWKAGTSFTNDASSTGIGSIDSTGSVSDTAGFSIVSYTGTGSAGTIKHGLSATANFMIIKNRDSSFQWVVYHHKNTSAPETDYLYLSSNAATADFAGHFNDTAPTSSVFTVGTDTGVNKNSQNHIAYLWSEKQGFSKFSSFRGNSNSDGVFVMCGFRPSMVWIKRTEGSNHWFIWDKHRDGFNESNEYLKADASEAESDGVNRINILSNGFKITTSNDGVNAEEEYIFMAWADAPFVNSNGVPCNAR